MERKTEPLKCESCKKDILTIEEGGLIVQVENVDTGDISQIYACCDSDCYDYLKELKVGSSEVDRYIDIAELKNPLLFLQNVIGWMEKLHDGVKIEDEAFENLKLAIIRSAQFVLRDMTDEEREFAIRINRERIDKAIF
jgi:hypothetical protein